MRQSRTIASPSNPCFVTFCNFFDDYYYFYIFFLIQIHENIYSIHNHARYVHMHPHISTIIVKKIKKYLPGIYVFQRESGEICSSYMWSSIVKRQQASVCSPENNARKKSIFWGSGIKIKGAQPSPLSSSFLNWNAVYTSPKQNCCSLHVTAVQSRPFNYAFFFGFLSTS